MKSVIEKPSVEETAYEDNQIEDNQSRLQSKDPFDNIDSLRLSQNFSELIGVKKTILTIPVRKPNRQEFIRVRPGDEWCIQAAILELKEERISYLVDPVLLGELPGEVIPKILYITISRQEVLSIWPVRLPGQDGRQDHWNRSAMDAAELAKKNWVRIASNMGLGAYEVFTASSDIQEPKWPDLSFAEILKIAFRDQYIKDLEHPVVQRLKGLR